MLDQSIHPAVLDVESAILDGVGSTSGGGPVDLSYNSKGAPQGGILSAHRAGVCPRLNNALISGNAAADLDVVSLNRAVIYDIMRVMEARFRAYISSAGLVVESAGDIGGKYDGKVRGEECHYVTCNGVKYLLVIKAVAASSFKNMVDRGVGAANPALWFTLQYLLGHSESDTAILVIVNRDSLGFVVTDIPLVSDAVKRVTQNVKLSVFSGSPVDIPDSFVDATHTSCIFCPFKNKSRFEHYAETGNPDDRCNLMMDDIPF